MHSQPMSETMNIESNSGFKAGFFILLAVLAGILLWTLSGRIFPFTFDSFVYTSTAQNIHLGKGLVYANFYVENSTNDFSPLNLQPPGYPILISFFMFFGMDAFTAGLLVPRVCFLILPLLFYLIFKRLMPSSAALAGAFACTFTFAVVQCALTAWSDVPCLCFSLAALLAAFRVIEKRKPPFPLSLLAGILAGYVYLIRFVGISLIFSIGVGFILCAILKLISKKDCFKMIWIYLGGASLVIVPYLYRNWCVFGTIQSYSVPHSNVPWTKNFMDYGETLSLMLWGSPSMMWLAAFFIIAIGVFILIKSKRMMENNGTTFVFTAILATYFLTNSLSLIVFRTLWFSVEKIDSRYLVQIFWILMMAVVWSVYYGMDFLKRKGDLKKPRTVGFLLLLTFILVQAFAAQDFFKTQEKVLGLSQTIKNHLALLQKTSPDTVIVTNLPDLVYYHIQRNVRALNFYIPYDLTYIFSHKRKFIVFLVKDAWNPQIDWGWYSVEWVHPRGYYKIFSDDHIDAFAPIQFW